MKKNKIVLLITITLISIFSFNKSVNASDTDYYFTTNIDDINASEKQSILKMICSNPQSSGYGMIAIDCKYHFKEIPKDIIDYLDNEGWTKESHSILDLYDKNVFFNHIDKIDRFSIASKENIQEIKDTLLNNPAYNVCGENRGLNCYKWIAKNYCGNGEKDFSNPNKAPICLELSKIEGEKIEDSNTIKCGEPLYTYRHHSTDILSIHLIFKYEKKRDNLYIEPGDAGSDSLWNYNKKRLNAKDGINHFNIYPKDQTYSSIEKELKDKVAKGICNLGTFCMGKESEVEKNVEWYFELSEEACEDKNKYNGISQSVSEGNAFLEKINDIDLIPNIEFKPNTSPVCENGKVFGDDNLTDKVKLIINLFRIVIPILLIVLGTIDFAKAVMEQSEDEIKKAQRKFIKRLIIGIVIFIIPAALKIILGIAHEIWEEIDASLCGLI